MDQGRHLWRVSTNSKGKLQTLSDNSGKTFFSKLTVSHAREHYEDWGKYHCTVDFLFDWFGISCMTTDNLQNGLIQTGQTGGQLYSDTSPFRVDRSYWGSPNTNSGNTNDWTQTLDLVIMWQMFYYYVIVAGQWPVL